MSANKFSPVKIALAQRRVDLTRNTQTHEIVVQNQKIDEAVQWLDEEIHAQLWTLLARWDRVPLRLDDETEEQFAYRLGRLVAKNVMATCWGDYVDELVRDTYLSPGLPLWDEQHPSTYAHVEVQD